MHPGASLKAEEQIEPMLYEKSWLKLVISNLGSASDVL